MMTEDWSGRKPDDPTPIVYHGGWHRRFLLSPCLKAGVKFFGCSFYEMRRVSGMLVRLRDQITEPPSKPVGPHPRLFLDSGAFSFLATYGKSTNLKIDLETYLKDYVTFVRNSPLLLDFYVTFDYRPEAQLTWDMTKRLQKLGIRPIPVYHGDASIDWVKKYIDRGHRLIGLSKRFFLNDKSGLRHFYDQTFKVTEAAGVACHGLACTGPEMWEYPWHSVDSTSIIGAASRGSLAYVENGAFKMFPIGKNRIGEHLPDDLQETMKRFGYRSLKDFDHYSPRIEFCMRRFLEYQKTRQAKSWTKRSLF